MSKQVQNARITVPEIRTRKGSEKIVCLTAYTSRMAELLDAHCDILLSATLSVWCCTVFLVRSA